MAIQSQAHHGMAGRTTIVKPLPVPEFLSVQEVAAILNVSHDTVGRLFADRDGVINLGTPETRYKRRHSLLRISHKALDQLIAERQVQRLRRRRGLS